MTRTYTIGLGGTFTFFLLAFGSAVAAPPLRSALPTDGRPSAKPVPALPDDQAQVPAAATSAPATVGKPIGPGHPETVRAADVVRETNPRRQVVRLGPAAEVVRPAPAAAPAGGRPQPSRPRPGGDAEQAKLPAGVPAAATAPAPVRPPSPHQLKLAPSASEIESERRPSNLDSPTPAVGANGQRDPREGTPRQDPRWPTHVDHTRGPGSPVGAGTSGDRKGTLEDASGPQQGVIRNRW
jgi:hypothetical protein